MQFTSCIFFSAGVKCRKPQVRHANRHTFPFVWCFPTAGIWTWHWGRNKTASAVATYNRHKQEWIFLQWQGVDILSVATMAAQVNEHNINHVCPFLVIIVRADETWWILCSFTCMVVVAMIFFYLYDHHYHHHHHHHHSFHPFISSTLWHKITK